MAKKGKSSDDEAKRRLEQTVSAFNSALMGSFATLKRADVAQLGKMSPDEFATKYCSSPLGVFDIKIKKLEIRKEQKLVFFGLAERQLEFLPVLSLLELKPHDSRIEAILEATDGVLDYTLAFIYYVTPHGSPVLDDVKVFEVRVAKNAPTEIMKHEVMLARVKSFEKFVETIASTTVGQILIEAIKKVLGL